MKKSIKNLLFAFLLFANLPAAIAQTAFTDAFTTNFAAWRGDTAKFAIVAGEAALNTTGTGAAYIATPAAMQDSTSWMVYVRQAIGSGGPSATNFSRIVLQSDVADVSGAFNGYYLQIGETGSDTIRFYRKNGTTSTKLFSANTGISINPTLARLKVTRSSLGFWQLFVDNTGAAAFNLVGSGSDNTYPRGNFFALQVGFTSTNASNKFFFDDVMISPLFVDNTPPSLVSATGVSLTQVDVLFNEALKASSANTATNYSINNGIAIQNASLDAVNPNLVHLTTTLLQSGTNYTLTTNALQDVANNASSTQTANFSYILPQVALEYDVLINEIMADPTPQIGLPNVEWLELYNRSTKNINLNSLRLKIGNGTQQVLPNYILPANGYAIICKVMSDTALTAYSPVFPIASFGLVNTGDSLMLYNAANTLIHKVTYKDSWYGSTTKAGGGYTLELKNVAQPCLGASNWSGSNSATGGTPAAQNSLYSNQADTQAPRMVSATALTATSLQVSFNEPVHNVLNTNAFSVNNGIGNPQNIVVENDTSVVLNFATAFISNQLNTLTNNGATDCSGNVLTNGTVSFKFLNVQPATRYDLLINEIYADPTPSLGLPLQEYVEIYNRSTKNIQLQGMLLASGSSGCFLPFYVMQPNTYIIVTSTDVGDFSAYGTNFHLTSFPSPSNSGDDLRLVTPGGTLIDAVNYDISWYNDPSKNDGGFSLERINANKPCEAETNWRASNAPIGGTPGTVNSVNQTSLDQIAPTLIRAFPTSATQIQLYFSEAMADVSPSAFSISTLGNPASVSTNSPYFNIVTLNLASPLLLGKRYTVSASIAVKDCVGNPLAATSTVEIGLPEQADTADLIINEILFNPNTNGTDFVELYNNSKKVIDLATCVVATGGLNGSFGAPVNIETNFLVFPGDYVVLTSDPITLKQQYNIPFPKQVVSVNLPTLDDKTGSVVMVSMGKVLDRLDYSDGWQYSLLSDKNGVSLERVYFNSPTQDLNNWHSAAASVGYATPTYRNSQARDSTQVAATANDVLIAPEVISPDGDGFNDFCTITYNTTTNESVTATITVFDAAGRLVKTLARNQLLETVAGIQWDGTTALNQKAPMGYYVILVDVFTPSGTVSRVKKTVVVASKL